MFNQDMLVSGDRVELIDSVMYGNWKVGDTGTVIGPAFGKAGAGYFVDMDKSPGSRVHFSARRLVKFQDDPLPPVPDSVEYREAVLPKLFLRARIRSDGLGVQMQIADPGVIVLDPDSALQLAHDIRRLAMQIKRNQKQEQAE